MMRRCLAVLALIALVLGVEHVRAAPLDAATCGMLKGEQVQLEQGGARANMAKGPDWAKGNLAADKLEQIKRLLFVDEQLLFRCSARMLVELPPEADAEPKAPSDSEPGQEDGQAPAKDKAPAAKDKAAPAAKKAAVSPKSDTGPGQTAPVKKDAPAKTTGAPRAAEKAAAPKPKPKPKVDDAFKAPLPDPKADPFANQPRQ